MKPIDPLEETMAFTETVKLIDLSDIDIKEISVFFPDALLIRDEDYRDEKFGLGLYYLMRTDPARFAQIISLHVKNYKVLGFRLVAENPSPFGVLAGMFILSVAVKEEGEELFKEFPPPDYIRKVIEEITLSSSPEEAVEKARKLLPLKGLDEESAFLSHPDFYLDALKRTTGGKEISKELLTLFVSHFVGIISSFEVVVLKKYWKERTFPVKPKEEKEVGQSFSI